MKTPVKGKGEDTETGINYGTYPILDEEGLRPLQGTWSRITGVGTKGG